MEQVHKPRQGAPNGPTTMTPIKHDKSAIGTGTTMWVIKTNPESARLERCLHPGYVAKPAAAIYGSIPSWKLEIGVSINGSLTPTQQHPPFGEELIGQSSQEAANLDIRGGWW